MTHSDIHTQGRCTTRELNYTAEFLAGIAKQYTEDTAVILGKRISPEGIRYGYELIVRNQEPKTIMTRRQSQNFDKRNFQVNKVVYL